ncbi:hypothetical protein GCM10027317_38870 [Massilia agri]
MSIHCQAAAAFEDHAIEGPAIFFAAHAPGPGPADEFGKRRAWLEQKDKFGEGVDHIRTLANEMCTFDYIPSGTAAL